MKLAEAAVAPAARAASQRTLIASPEPPRAAGARAARPGMRPARRTHLPASGKMAAMPNEALPSRARPRSSPGPLPAPSPPSAARPAGQRQPGGPASSPAASPARRDGPGRRAALASPARCSRCRMQCASLQVPLDYRHPAGRKITLAAVEVPATAPAAPAAGLTCSSTRAAGRQRPVAGARRSPRGLDPTVASEYNIIGFDPRGVGSSVPALHCDPSFFAGVRPDYIPANAACRAGAARAGEELRRRLRAPVRLAAAVHDHGRHGAGHGFHPGRPGPAEDQLLRLLLGHLPGTGVRDPVPAPAAPDGARQRREPAGRLVRRQHRPGLRVRGQDPGVLLLDRRSRRASTTSAPPGPGPAGVVPGAGQARGPPDQPARPAR